MKSLDQCHSRLRGNDILLLYRGMQQCPYLLTMTIFLKTDF
ncbi:MULTISPECIES: hypothetical protein [unclassified Rickettsia]